MGISTKSIILQGSRGGPTFTRGGPSFSRGGGGSNCLFPIETHITCDFPGGVRTPCPPSGSALDIVLETHGRIQREGGGAGGIPLKSRKNIGFLSITGPDPLKIRIYQASIQCWAIIGPPAKHHLNGVSLAGR